MSKGSSDDDKDRTTNVWSPDLKFRYSTDQVLEYARFLDFIYERHIDVIRDLHKIVIIRAVAQTKMAVV